MIQNSCKKGHPFSPNKTKGRICNICQARYCKEWRLKNKEYVAKYAKKYGLENREKIINYIKNYTKQNREKIRLIRQKNFIKNKYGVSYKDFDKLIIVQKNKCAICKTVMTQDRCLDHDHKNNKPRGLLCRKCNWLLGYSNDSIDILKKSIIYLKKYQRLR